MSDVGGQELSFAEVKAIASGNPAVLTLAEIEADLQLLALLKRSHADEQYSARQQVRTLPDEIDRLERRAASLDEDHARASTASPGVTIGGRTHADREHGIEAMNALLKQRLQIGRPQVGSWPVGAYRGFRLSLDTRPGAPPELAIAGTLTYHREFKTVAAGALLNYIDTLVDRLPNMAREDLDRRNIKITQLGGFRARTGQAFEQERRLERLRHLHGALEAVLSGQGDGDDRARANALVAEFRFLKEERPPQAAPQAELLVLQDLPPAARPPALTQAWQARRAMDSRTRVTRQAALKGAQLNLF
jgi:hypothetical protein